MLFGWKLREAHFKFAPDVVNLNHGSYGAPPKEVLDARFAAIEEEVAFPDEYVRLKHDDISKQTRQVMARVLDADVDNLVLTVNATMAINAVLRSYPFRPGAKVAKFTTIYNACDNTLRMISEKFGVETVEIPLDLPTTQDEIVEVFERVVDKVGDVTMAMFDTVSSMPSVRFPWERLVVSCRSRGILSLVDGAHGIGLIPISLRDVRPDFFTTNAHKWFLASHSCAALYVDPAHHRKINSLPVSANYFPMDAHLTPEEDHTTLARTFVYVGTADHSAVQSVLKADEFRRRVCGGESAIMDYQRQLSRDASRLLCKELNTTEVSDFGWDQRCALFTLLYPLQPLSPKDQAELVQWTNEYMMTQWKTIMPLSSYRGKVYVRFSAAPYVDLDDFRYGAKVLKAAMEAWNGRTKTA